MSQNSLLAQTQICAMGAYVRQTAKPSEALPTKLSRRHLTEISDYFCWHQMVPSHWL